MCLRVPSVVKIRPIETLKHPRRIGNLGMIEKYVKNLLPRKHQMILSNMGLLSLLQLMLGDLTDGPHQEVVQILF